MGTEPAQDAVLFRQFTKEENEKLATTWGPGGSLSRDGKWLVLGYGTGTRTNDLWVADFEPFPRDRQAREARASRSAGRPASARLRRRRHALPAHQPGRAERPRRRRRPPANPAQAALEAADRVPERKDAVIQSVVVARGLLAVEYLKNAASVDRAFRLRRQARGRAQDARHRLGRRSRPSAIAPRPT